MLKEDTLTDIQKNIFDAIPKDNVGELKTLLSQLKGTADFVDENGMTPLQHACYKGSTELVQLLLDQVSDGLFSQCLSICIEQIIEVMFSLFPGC